MDNVNISRYNSGLRIIRYMTTENKALPITEQKDYPQLSRRSFLKATAGALVAAGSVLLYENYSEKINRFLGNLENNPLNGSANDVEIANKKAHKTEGEELLGTIREIKSKYGIEIPSKEGEYVQYQVCLDANKDLVRCGTEDNSTQITNEEAGIIEKSLSKIPAVGKLAQLIIPFRKDGTGVVGGGSYMGQNWEYFLDPAKYQNYPMDRYLSDKSAVELFLPKNTPDETLPPVTRDSNFLPILVEASMNSAGIKAKNRVDYPWTTYGERLKQVTIHEIGGHGVKEFATGIKVNHNPKAENDASAMSMYGGIPLDTNNPIYSSFAKVNGWVQIPYGEFLTQWGKDGQNMSENLKINDPKRAEWKVWDRDPNIWGNIKERNVRLDTYASYGTINETFATFFMFYTLSKTDKNYDRSLLTEAEIKYFDRMFNGLSKNPEKYVKTLIDENPGPSFDRDIFKPKTGQKSEDNQLLNKLIVPEYVVKVYSNNLSRSSFL
jgi:hypothetical protein